MKADTLLSMPVLLGLALTLRVAWAVAVPMVLFSDPGVYDAFARNIAEHGVYGVSPESPTAYWAVGASAIYGALYAITGPSQAAIAGFNIAVSLVIVWLTAQVGSQWFGRTTGRLAALFVAVWPALIQFVNFPNSELLFTALLLGALWVWGRQARPVARGALTGVLLGAATLVRPIAMLLPIVFAIAQRTGSKAGARLVPAALALVCVGLVVSPWTLRNYNLFGEVVLVSTNLGPNLWMGNNPASTGRYQVLPADAIELDEPTRDAVLRAEAIAHIRQDPAAFATRFVTKIGYMFSRETTGVTWNGKGLEQRFGPRVETPVKVLSTGFWYAMLGLAFIGIFRLARSEGPVSAVLSLPVLIIGYFAVVHGVIFVSDRFHIPLNPLIASLAAYGLIGARFRSSPGAA